MIYTSYFKKSFHLPNTISIALSVPEFYQGPSYPNLFPTWTLITEYKSGIITEQQYTESYLKLLEYRYLDPMVVTNELDERVLLCWEGPGKFCHRHIVADWLKPYTDVEEIGDITLF